MTVSGGGMTVGGCGVSVSRCVVGAEAVVDEVDVAEVTVLVGVTVVVSAVLGVASSGSAWLIIGVAVGAYDERIVIFVVESVVAAFAYNQSHSDTL